MSADGSGGSGIYGLLIQVAIAVGIIMWMANCAGA